MKRSHIPFVCLLAALAAGCFAGCNIEPDIAPIPTYTGEANTTIAELLALHQIGSSDSYDHISEDSADIVISGIVTSSDEHGNCYKYLNIEDGTGGIQVRINNSYLYKKYRVGQRIYVKCNGLDLGDYRKLPCLGIWANGSIQQIPSGKVSRYVFLDGAPGTFTPALRFTSIPRVSDVPATYYNRLVVLENASFTEGGTANFSADNSATSRDIVMADGTTITMRTSNYADFRQETLPAGTGTVTGILTRYNNTLQIVIRSLDDLQGFGSAPHTADLFTVNYGSAFADGWLRATSGSEWSVLSNTSFTGFLIQPQAETDSWLISPAINLAGAAEPLLTYSHRISGNSSNATMKCYYTLNYTGDVSTTDWTEIPVSGYSSTFQNERFSIPASACTSGFRFAYRYTGKSTIWAINNINISATVNQ